MYTACMDMLAVYSTSRSDTLFCSFQRTDTQRDIHKSLFWFLCVCWCRPHLSQVRLSILWEQGRKAAFFEHSSRVIFSLDFHLFPVLYSLVVPWLVFLMLRHPSAPPPPLALSVLPDFEELISLCLAGF